MSIGDITIGSLAYMSNMMGYIQQTLSRISRIHISLGNRCISQQCSEPSCIHIIDPLHLKYLTYLKIL